MRFDSYKRSLKAARYTCTLPLYSRNHLLDPQFSGAHWLLGSWYKDSELGKCSALFACFVQIGSPFSGFMQGEIYSSLNGNVGKSGWQRTFIIDGVIAIVIALNGALVFPDTPNTLCAACWSSWGEGIDLGGCGCAGQGSNFAWENEVSRTDLERSLTLYSMNLWSNASTTWWILLIWPVSSAPRYRRGMISTIPISIISILIGWITQVLHKRSMREDKIGRSDESLRSREECGDAHSDTDREPNEEKKAGIQ
ncbi:hypothetical protein FRC08_014658 [Ceratobasidium sp. 394]|nr:hypothetical protein FRC08_014658 [Ceratobasidium sp. 394]